MFDADIRLIRMSFHLRQEHIKRHDMKKLSITLLLFAMSAMTFAVPARRGLSKTVTLADGTKVKVELRGDEHGHYWQSADGVRYVASETNGIYKVADM